MGPSITVGTLGKLGKSRGGSEAQRSLVGNSDDTPAGDHKKPLGTRSLSLSDDVRVMPYQGPSCINAVSKLGHGQRMLALVFVYVRKVVVAKMDGHLGQ